MFPNYSLFCRVLQFFLLKKIVIFVILKCKNMKNKKLNESLIGYSNDLEGVKNCLKQGADINYQNKDDGYTVLMMACSERGNYDVAKYLIEKGAELDITDKMCISAIKHAASVGKTDIINLLLDNGADINNAEDGESALCHALIHGKFDAAKLLIERGIDCTIQTDEDELNIVEYDYNELDDFPIYNKQSGTFDNVVIDELQVGGGNNNTINWLKSYENQKMIIDRFPSLYKSFRKMKYLNNKIKKEYAHLNTGVDLNLV